MVLKSEENETGWDRAKEIGNIKGKIGSEVVTKRYLR